MTHVANSVITYFVLVHAIGSRLQCFQAFGWRRIFACVGHHHAEMLTDCLTICCSMMRLLTAYGWRPAPAQALSASSRSIAQGTALQFQRRWRCCQAATLRYASALLSCRLLTVQLCWQTHENEANLACAPRIHMHIVVRAMH